MDRWEFFLINGDNLNTVWDERQGICHGEEENVTDITGENISIPCEKKTCQSLVFTILIEKIR